MVNDYITITKESTLLEKRMKSVFMNVWKEKSDTLKHGLKLLDQIMQVAEYDKLHSLISNK